MAVLVNAQPWFQQFDNSSQSAVLGSWTSGLAIPDADHNEGCRYVVTNGKVLCLGGYDDTGSELGVTNIYQSTLSSGVPGSWSAHTNSLTEGIYFFSIAITKDKLYVIGGRTGDATGEATLRTYYSTIAGDGTLGTFTRGTDLPAEVSHGGIVATSGRIYYLGGLDQYGVATTAIYYATVNDTTGIIGTWSTDSNTTPNTGEGGNVLRAGGTVYWFGWNTSNDVVHEATISGSALGAFSDSGYDLPAQERWRCGMITEDRLWAMGYGGSSTLVRTAPMSGENIGTWTSDTALPAARSSGQVFITSARVYYFDQYGNDSYYNGFSGGSDNYTGSTYADPPSTADGEIDSPAAVLEGAANVTVDGEIDAPKPILSAYGVTDGAGWGQLVAPVPILSGSAYNPIVVNGNIKSPRALMHGQALWYAGHINSPAPILSGTAMAGIGAWGEISSPKGILSGSAENEVTVNGNIEVPLARLSGYAGTPDLTVGNIYARATVKGLAAHNSTADGSVDSPAPRIRAKTVESGTSDIIRFNEGRECRP